jgi:hypothetical protein
MAVFNDQGICTLTEGQAASPLLTTPWLKRLPILLQRSATIIEAFSKMNAIETDKDALLQGYCRIPSESPFKTQISKSGDEPPKSTLTLKLSRMRTVAERHATGLLIDYAAYMARLAHPHDLARVK